MAQVLPDEILVKIARACVEPFHIAIFCKPDADFIGAVSDISMSIPPIDGYTNIKLVNRLFHQEIRNTINYKFNGQLHIGSTGPWRTNSDLGDMAAALREYLDKKMTGILPQIHEVKCRSLDSDAIVGSCCDRLPNLRKISCRFEKLKYPESPCSSASTSRRKYTLGDVLEGNLDCWIIEAAGLSGRFELRTDHGIDITCSLVVELPHTGEEIKCIIDLSECWNEKVVNRVVL